MSSKEDLGSLKVLYITSNGIYNSHSESLHNNTEYTLMHYSCQSPIEDRCLLRVLQANCLQDFYTVTKEGEILTETWRVSSVGQLSASYSLILNIFSETETNMTVKLHEKPQTTAKWMQWHLLNNHTVVLSIPTQTITWYLNGATFTSSIEDHPILLCSQDDSQHFVCLLGAASEDFSGAGISIWKSSQLHLYRYFHSSSLTGPLLRQTVAEHSGTVGVWSVPPSWLV